MDEFLVLKEEKTPYGDYIYKLIDKETGATVFEWNDSASLDYPEDLVWHRMISEVFSTAFKLGQKYGGR